MEENELVRLRAYEIWIREGQPEGRELEHWLQARREITGAQPPKPETARSGTDTGDGAATLQPERTRTARETQ